MADIEKVIKGLQIERECVSRDCDRNCGQCDLVQDRDWLLSVYDDALELLKEQQPKHGHWIEQEGFDSDVYYDCSVCGESWVTVEGTPEDNGMIYCPHCGAKMDEPKAGEQE